MADTRKLIITLVLLAVIAGITVPSINAQTTGKTMLQNLATHPELSSVVNMARGAGLISTLNGPAQYTIFAPTNNAIAALPSDRVNALMGDKPLLTNLVSYHVVPGKLTYADLKGIKSVKTIDGRILPVTVNNGVVSVGGVQVPNNGIDSSNGMIYPVNSVLMPPGFALPQVQTSRSTGLPWQWLALLLGALIVIGGALYALSRKGKHATYEKTYEKTAYETARPRPEEHYKAEDTMRKVRESVSGVSEPKVADIAKNVDLPLSGDAQTGLNELISKGTFANKQDFMGFLGKQFLQNNLGAAMVGGGLSASTVLDIINKTGIAKGFMEGDIKKYLVPLFIAGFTAIYKYLSKQPAVKNV